MIRCAAIGCTVRIAIGTLLCPSHLDRLPAWMRHQLYRRHENRNVFNQIKQQIILHLMRIDLDHGPVIYNCNIRSSAKYASNNPTSGRDR